MVANKINVDELAHYSPRGCEDANEKEPIWHNELHLRKKRLAHSFWTYEHEQSSICVAVSKNTNKLF